jgi:hypothetical protein
MNVRQTAATGGAIGLIVSGTVLVLLWRFGVWRLMTIGSTDLRVVLWPSSVMLTSGWRSTLPGIMTTISSIAINCLVYMAIALLLRAGIRAARTTGRGAGNRAHL